MKNVRTDSPYGARPTTASLAVAGCPSWRSIQSLLALAWPEAKRKNPGTPIANATKNVTRPEAPAARFSGRRASIERHVERGAFDRISAAIHHALSAS